MIKHLFLSVFLASGLYCHSQNSVNGSVLEEKNFNFKPIDGKFLERDVIGAGKGKEINFILTDAMTGKVDLYTVPFFSHEGIVSRSLIRSSIIGDYFYEFHAYTDESKDTPGWQIGLLKRNIQDGFKVEGPMQNITEYDQERETVEIYNDKRNFYVLVRHNPLMDIGPGGINKPGTKNKPVRHFVIRSDFDFTNQYISQAPFFAESTVQLQAGKSFVDDGGNLILSIAVRSSENQSVNHALIIYGDEDTPYIIVPQVDESFSFTNYKLFFDNEKKELVGLYIIKEQHETQKKNKKEGYKYFRWNKDGEIVTSYKYFYKYKDILTEEVKQYLKMTGQIIEESENDFIPEHYTAYLAVPTIIPKLDGGCLIEYHSYTATGTEAKTFNKMFLKNEYLFSINKEGQLEWTKAYLGQINGVYNPASLFVVENDIIVISKTHECFFENDEYVVKEASGKELLSNTTVYKMEILDLQSGELKSVSKFGDPELWSYLFKEAFHDDGSVYVEFRNTRRNSMFYSKIDLDN